MAKSPYTEPTLDKDLHKIGMMESAAQFVMNRAAAPAFALVFIICAASAAITMSASSGGMLFIAVASVMAAYMAMNIGANDVTNNVGAAVGARAISLRNALILAALCEIAGAFLAGDRVVATIKDGIINTRLTPDPDMIIVIMVSALFAAAAWINIATWLNAPVSTTHSIVGGIMGAGAAIAGAGAVDWTQLAEISAGWLFSPIAGGIIAIAFLWFIQTAILYAQDRLGAAMRWVPFLLAVMSGAFVSYLLLLGFDGGIDLTAWQAIAIGTVIGLIGYIPFRRAVARQSAALDAADPSIKSLFRTPLVFSAALLSFAHGANDVSNAIGPLFAVVEASGIQSVTANQDAPFWVMALGAFGISIGLLLFGPRLIRIVGSQITKLNPIRAFCVALSAALTVIVASALGLPVSSTHIAVGSVFGVGLFREWHVAHSSQRRLYIEAKALKGDKKAARELMASRDASKAATQAVDNTYRYLVRRSYLLSILAAWVVTAPVSGALAAGIATALHRFVQ
ncbi:PiT family inorganic phosphate transporter [Rhizobium sp. SG_E_25_P2]|uniref:inorganic phosphate transporter n=1 Tax=Rhizobium sp. SG_E_25_P2 TaxID=2879942 RepID=UPI00247559C8|nr:inorganic phosphate transporter [Rhizobium sp. SG_E_25_P2]MDH6264730.1 PiT family inorganic phosphate transporter [Rhizobium sp. SG_E_25_P2]